MLQATSRAALRVRHTACQRAQLSAVWEVLHKEKGQTAHQNVPKYASQTAQQNVVQVS